MAFLNTSQLMRAVQTAMSEQSGEPVPPQMRGGIGGFPRYAQDLMQYQQQLKDIRARRRRSREERGTERVAQSRVRQRSTALNAGGDTERLG